MNIQKDENSSANQQRPANSHFGVPPDCYEFVAENGIQTKLRIKEIGSSAIFREYQCTRDDSSCFYCIDCFEKCRVRTYAYFWGGNVKAPLQHPCSIEIIKNEIKAEVNDSTIPPILLTLPSSSQDASSSSSNVAGSSRQQPSRSESRASDVIFLDDDDEIIPDNQESTQQSEINAEFRGVPPEEYEKCMGGRNGITGSRLIVFEPNNRTQVKQYANNYNNCWFCINCVRISRKRPHTRGYFDDNDEIFMASADDHHICSPISYEEAQKEQKKILEKFNKTNAAMVSEDGVKNKASQYSDHIGRTSLRVRTPDRSEDAIRENHIGRINLRVRTPPPDRYQGDIPVVKKRQRVKRKRLISRKIVVKPDGYFYGIGSLNQAKGRLIVYESPEKTHARQFRRNKEDYWRCEACSIISRSQVCYAKVTKENNLRLSSAHKCQPQTIEEIMKEQQEINDRYAEKELKEKRRRTPDPQSCPQEPGSSKMGRKRRGPQKKINVVPPSFKTKKSKRILSSSDDSSDDSSSSSDSGSTTSAASQKSPKPKNENSTTPGSSCFTSPISTPIDTQKPRISVYSKKSMIPSSSKPSTSNIAFQETKLNISKSPGNLPATKTNTLKSHITESSINKNATTLQKKPAPQTDLTILQPSKRNLTKTTRMYKPSEYFLEKCCEKLKVSYSEAAFEFWCTIKIKTISPTSKPEMLHIDTNLNEFFGCISIYFTGSKEAADEIQKAVNKFIYIKNTESGAIIDRKAEEEILFSTSATPFHFAAVAERLSCRIGVYEAEAGVWKIFGDWEIIDADIPTMLMEKKNDGNFYPILLI